MSPACWDPLHGGPASRGSISRDLPAVQAAASRDRCFKWHRFRGSWLTVLLPAPRAFSQPPCGMTVSDELVKDSFLSIGVRPVTPACFPVGSSRVVSDRFLSTGARPVPLALFRAGPSRLTSGRSFRLVSGPFVLAASRPRAPAEELRYIPTRQGEHTLLLVLAYDRNMETTVHATAAVPGRAQVNHCSGRHRMLYPVAANVLSGAPIRLRTTEEDGPFGQLGDN